MGNENFWIRNNSETIYAQTLKVRAQIAQTLHKRLSSFSNHLTEVCRLHSPRPPELKNAKLFNNNYCTSSESSRTNCTNFAQTFKPIFRSFEESSSAENKLVFLNNSKANIAETLKFLAQLAQTLLQLLSLFLSHLAEVRRLRVNLVFSITREQI